MCQVAVLHIPTVINLKVKHYIFSALSKARVMIPKPLQLVTKQFKFTLHKSRSVGLVINHSQLSQWPPFVFLRLPASPCNPIETEIRSTPLSTWLSSSQSWHQNASIEQPALVKVKWSAQPSISHITTELKANTSHCQRLLPLRGWR